MDLYFYVVYVCREHGSCLSDKMLKMTFVEFDILSSNGINAKTVLHELDLLFEIKYTNRAFTTVVNAHTNVTSASNALRVAP